MTGRRIGALLAAMIVTFFPLSGTLRAADAGAAIKADADRINADIVQLQTDQRNLHQLVDPDRKALDAARQQLVTDSAPLQAKLKSDRARFQETLAAGSAALKTSRDQGEAGIRVLEGRLAEARRQALKDKSAAGQIPQQETALQAERDKLKAALQSAGDKLKSDTEAGNQALRAQREAMVTALKPDNDALAAAQKKLQSDLLWETKVAADQAALAADQQQLATDKQAAGQ